MLLLDDDNQEIELLINEFNKLKINDVNEYGINVYSFELKPEIHQPSGSYNVSKMNEFTFLSFALYPKSYAPSGCSYGVSRTSELYDYFK